MCSLPQRTKKTKTPPLQHQNGKNTPTKAKRRLTTTHLHLSIKNAPHQRFSGTIRCPFDSKRYHYSNTKKRRMGFERHSLLCVWQVLLEMVGGRRYLRARGRCEHVPWVVVHGNVSGHRNRCCCQGALVVEGTLKRRKK